jgi:probable phosphoglycerate mutase
VRVLLVRHAESLLNALGRVQGWADSPLTDRGREAATRLGRRLSDDGVRLVGVHTADGIRHRETAELVTAAAGASLAPAVDPRLRELGFGAFEGAREEELRRALLGDGDAGLQRRTDRDTGFLELIARLPARSLALGAPAEAPRAACDRVVAALDALARSRASAGGGDVLVVSSGIGIMLALTAFGTDAQAMRGGIRNGALNILHWSAGGWAIERVNDAGATP